MEKSTDYYIKLHLSYLSGLSMEKRQVELENHETIHDHMYDFFRKLDLSHEEALSVIDDFRSDSLIEDVRFQASQ